MSGGRERRPRGIPDAVAATVTSLRAARLVIREARKLIDRPQHWTRGALCRDSRGRRVLPDDPHAVRWCVNGALLRAGARREHLQLALAETADEVPGIVDLRELPESAREAVYLVVVTLNWRGIRTGRGESALSLPEAVNDARGGSHATAASMLREADATATALIRKLEGRR